MKKIVVICLCLLLTGCKYDSTVNHIDSLLQETCEFDNIECDGLFWEMEVKSVGFYGMAKGKFENQEKVIIIVQHIDKERWGPGLKYIAYATEDNDSYIISNEGEVFGHENNFYIIIVFDDIHKAKYKDKEYKITKKKIELNGNPFYISIWSLQLDKNEELIEDDILYS